MNQTERTLGFIKPDALAQGLLGKILDQIIGAGFRIAGLKLLQLTREQAEAFYGVHREKPFFHSLVAFMTSGPIVAFVLEKENAVAEYRALMGATDPAKATPGTLRALFGQSIERNAVHGSDSPENAQREIAFFFAESELLPAPTPVRV